MMEKVMIKEERKDESAETSHQPTHDLTLPFLCDLVSASREESSGHKNKTGFGKTNMDLTKISSMAIPPTQKVSPTSSAALRNISGLGLTSALVDSTMNLSPPLGDPVSKTQYSKQHAYHGGAGSRGPAQGSGCCQ